MQPRCGTRPVGCQPGHAVEKGGVDSPEQGAVLPHCASQESIAAGSISYHSWIHCMAVLFYFSCLEEKAEKCSKSTQGYCLLWAVKSLLLSYNPFTEERQVKRFLTDKLKTE